MNKIKKLLSDAIKDLYGIKEDVVFMLARKGQGHFSFVGTMKLAKELRKTGEEVANELMAKISTSEFISNFEIIKPGFLNFSISDNALLDRLENIEYEKIDSTIVIDYGAENIAKHMSVGHLRSNIIGKVLANIYEKLGWNVIKDNHLGDYGTQFGKLIYAYKNWGDDKIIDKDPIEELNKLYVYFHEQAEKDPTLDEFAREEFKKLENGDSENIEIWKKFIELSMKEFKQMYDYLGSEFDTFYGESFYLSMLPGVIKEIDDKIGKTGEKGAKIIEFDSMTPLMYQKKDGATLYATRDFATIKFRIGEYNPKKIAYVVGKDQTLHFRQLFKAASRLGWTDNIKLIHARFGMVRLPEGKMSTRKGRVIRLRDLIETAFKEARKLLETKDSYLEFDKVQQEKLVKDLAIGAIKFNDLSQDRETDITFTWEKAITFEGMSGPYMQYAHARTCGILRKVLDCLENYEADIKSLEFTHEKERSLAFLLGNYKDILIRSAEEFKPHLIARYIYDLSQEFNSFYAACSVINAKTDNEKKLRVFLVQKTQEFLKEGLELLGIVAPEKM